MIFLQKMAVMTLMHLHLLQMSPPTNALGSSQKMTKLIPLVLKWEARRPELSPVFHSFMRETIINAWVILLILTVSESTLPAMQILKDWPLSMKQAQAAIQCSLTKARLVAPSSPWTLSPNSWTSTTTSGVLVSSSLVSSCASLEIDLWTPSSSQLWHSESSASLDHCSFTCSLPK